MGCKTSAIRPEGSSGTYAHDDSKDSPSHSATKRKATRNTSQTSAGATSEPTRQGHSGTRDSATPEKRRSSRSSMPTSPRRSSLDTTHDPSHPHTASTGTGDRLPKKQVFYAQDDDPFAPPPPLPSQEAGKHDSVLTVHAGSSGSDDSDTFRRRVHTSESDDEVDRSDDDVDDSDDSYTRAQRRQQRRRENHFDPIPMPETAMATSAAPPRPGDKDWAPPRLPSAESRTVSKDNTATFRTNISDHDKTDSAAAAKEYQQRMEAKRNAEEVHTKRRRLEEFDPVRPVDSFNVTHRGLLGRCWDRRAPELIPVSFVHAIAKAIGVEESHPASTTTISHMSNGGDEFPPGSPIQHLSRLSRQSGARGSIGSSPMPATFPSTWTGVGGRRVPRRSHWFSVGGISTEGFNPAGVSSPTSIEPFYMSSTASSPTFARPSAGGAANISGSNGAAAAPVGTNGSTSGSALTFPATSAAMMLGGNRGGGVAMSSAALNIILNAHPSGTAAGSGGGARDGSGEAATRASGKGTTATNGAAAATSSAELDNLVDDATLSMAARTLTPEQVMALPWETREKYFNVMMSRNPRFMGIKDVFAFKLGTGVSNDRSVKFLRKRNLEPAPGVTAVRWNRVEFFHPSLHTLVRAVAKTQGMSLELSQIEQATAHAGEGVPASANDLTFSVTGLYANGSLNRSAAAAGPNSMHAEGVSAAAAAAATMESHNNNNADALHRSFSQFVMGHVENRSFSRAGGGELSGGLGGRSQNTSFLHTGNKTHNSGAAHVDKSTAAASGHDKSGEHRGLWTGGSFLMGFHRNQEKGADSGGGGSRGAPAPMHFPEDSVAALALGMPYSRLGELSGVPAVVRNAVMSNAGRLSGNLLYPSAMGLGSRKASRDTVHSVAGAASGSGGVVNASGSLGPNAYAPSRGSGFTALRPASESVLVSLCISSFSVSINPFEWQERQYTRYPIDIDGSKRSSRHNYGEGVVTDVMYGGIMVIECSSMTAVKELQSLLGSMAWTEERSLRGIVKDIRKHLKIVHNNLQKSRQAAAKKAAAAAAAAAAGNETASNAATTTTTTEAAAAKDWSAHRYRIIRRIGGRPMRDAVELEEISVFFDEEEEALREARTTLRQPDPQRKRPSALNEGPVVPGTSTPNATQAGPASATLLPTQGLDRSLTEARPANPHSSPNGPDPDTSSSFSRVASAWFGLPVISAVLRTWGLHLLACPEYAQPTSMFLQKHAGLAPVLQLTALGSFYHEGNTPSDEATAAAEPDDLFFESDGPGYDVERQGAAAATHHPQPAPRIPKYNRFYASLPASPTDAHDDDDDDNGGGGKEASGGGANANTLRLHRRGKGKKSSGTTTSGSGKEKSRDGRTSPGEAMLAPPGSKDAPTAASSPSMMMKGSSVALDEEAAPPAGAAEQLPDSSTGHGRLRVRDPTHYHDGDDDTSGLGPKSHSRETVEGEGGAHMADSQLSTNSPLGAGRQNTAVMSSSDNGGRPPGRSTAAANSSGSAPPKKVSATRPSSPLSPGRMTVPHSRRNNDDSRHHRRRHRHRRASSSSESAHSSASSSTASSATASSSSSSSFFASSSSNPTRHSTFVYQPASANNNHNNNNNNSSIFTSGVATQAPSASNSRLERKTTAPPLENDAALVSRSTTLTSISTAPGGAATSTTKHTGDHGAPRTNVPVSVDGVLGSSREASTVMIQSKPGSPHLFMPTPMMDSAGTGESCMFELVAMARTVGPEESVAAIEAQRQANIANHSQNNSNSSSSMAKNTTNSAKGSPRSPLGRRGSSRNLSSASPPADAPSSAARTPDPAPVTATHAASDSNTGTEGTPERAGKKKVKKAIKKTRKATPKKAKAGTAAAAAAPLTPATEASDGALGPPPLHPDISARQTEVSPPSANSITTTVIVEQREGVSGAPATTTVTLDTGSSTTSGGKAPVVPSVKMQKAPALPIAPSAANACDAKESQMRALGTPTGTAGRSPVAVVDTPSGASHSTANGFPTTSVTVGVNPTASSTVSSTVPHVSREEAEGLWYMTMLEVRAQRQELEDLRQARRNAEDHKQQRQDELRALNRVFLPHTHPQDLDCTLLYLKTVLFEPDDIPHGRLFLQQPDWLPLLAAVWTSPANRIRSVEVAAELTWMDIPRLGLITGLLYHHNATSSLEEFILRSDKLLGAPRHFPLMKSGGDDVASSSGGGGGGFLAKVRRQKGKKDKAKNEMEVSNTSLNFVTELDRTGTGFGPGCPPFFIAPEEARDTLWLLLCAIATNTTAANFRVVLKGMPTPETNHLSGGGGGSGSGGVSSGDGSPVHERSASAMFASFFSTKRRDERGDEPLLLKPESMLLDSFVVQPTLHDIDELNSRDAAHQRNPSLFRAAVPAVQVTGSPHPHTANNTFDEAGLISLSPGSMRFDGSGHDGGGTTANSPDQQRSPNNSRQPSSLIIVTSSLGNVTSQDPLGADESTTSAGRASPIRHTSKRSLSTLMTVRSINAAGHGSPPPAPTTATTAKPPTVVVPTHQHHVKRRPWVQDSVEVEERPFYEVLLHRCGPIEEARVAAANSGDPSLLASPYIAHYHHPYNAAHNDARFYVSVERQERLQQAVKRAAAVANGEAAPAQDFDASTAVYSSKANLTKPKQTEDPQQQSSEYTRTPSPPPPPVPCPPPLLFCSTNMVFGLDSAEEEAKVLLYEERQLRDRAPDIWTALRKSVKHYNQAQQEARHKAAKAAGKNASPPPPARQIILEN